jgi:hypothetical protein
VTDLMGLIPDLLASAAPAAEALPPEARRRGAALLVLVVMLGVVLLGSAGLLAFMGSRRRRLRALQRKNKPALVTPDPWTEAGKRMRTDDDPTDVD